MVGLRGLEQLLQRIGDERFVDQAEVITRRDLVPDRRVERFHVGSKLFVDARLEFAQVLALGRTSQVAPSAIDREQESRRLFGHACRQHDQVDVALPRQALTVRLGPKAARA